MKSTILILLLLSTFTCYSQTSLERMKGFWQNIEEESVINYYNGHTNLSFLYSRKKGGFGGGKYPSIIGFIDSCDVKSINLLKSSGTYFIVVEKDKIDEDKSLQEYECLELSISKEGEEEYMVIYRSSQQQFSTYRKLRNLPKNLEEYLKEKFPEIYKEYSSF